MNNFQKSLILVLFFVSIIVLTGRINADSIAIVKIEPDQNVAGLGQQFAVNVTISDVQNLFGFEVRLYWNSSILQLADKNTFLGVEDYPAGVGVLHKAVWTNETLRNDSYVIVATSIGEQTPSFNGSGTIVKLTFNVSEIGSSELELQTTLYNKPPPDQAATQIQHSTVSGHYSPIHISALPKEILLGENTTVSGYIITQGNVNATVQYRLQNQTAWLNLKNTTTTNLGNYTIEWKPEKEGLYEIRAIAIINNTKTESAIVNVFVKPTNGSWLKYLLTALVIVVIVVVALTIYLKRSRKLKLS